MKSRNYSSLTTEHARAPKPKTRKRIIITLLVVTFHTAGLLSSINAVMTTRTAPGAIAWGHIA